MTASIMCSRLVSELNLDDFHFSRHYHKAKEGHNFNTILSQQSSFITILIHVPNLVANSICQIIIHSVICSLMWVFFDGNVL